MLLYDPADVRTGTRIRGFLNACKAEKKNRICPLYFVIFFILPYGKALE